jgi:hypothetical protein
VTSPETPRRVEIKDESDHSVAGAEVSTASGADGTVRVSTHADAYAGSGHRQSLIDTVMDLPEVQASERVEATIPSGDVESLNRLRERTEDAQARAAGSTILFDANVPAGGQAAGTEQASEEQASEQPAGEQPAGEQPAGEQSAGGRADGDR